MSAAHENMPSGQLLLGVEAEVKRCMDILMRIEEEVLPLVSHPIAPTLRAALQDIDLLSQCLDDIARCLKGAANSTGAGFLCDATSILSAIRLQDMRMRLEGGSYDARKLTQREEMFDAPASSNAAEIHLF